MQASSPFINSITGQLPGWLLAILRQIHFSLRKGTIRRCLHWLGHGHFIRRQRIKAYCASHSVGLLQIGGGKYMLPGWLNGDLIAGEIHLNACRKLPFTDCSIERIFAEHFIEHITWQQAVALLGECQRILKPGGKIRLATPDLEKIAAVYRKQNPDVDLAQAMARHCKNHNRPTPTSAHFVNDQFRLWGHRFLHDYESLSLAMTGAGFKTPVRHLFGQSEDALLQNLERHADVDWMRDGLQLIVEAEKPMLQAVPAIR